MKDLETLLPMLREFLNERGLNEVNFKLTFSNVPIDKISNTYPLISAQQNDMILAKQTVKTHHIGEDTISFKSEYF